MNTHIWVNEDNARNGDDKENQLLLTHGLNGIRNTAKNKIQESIGGRKDYKIDCIASEFKDWEVSWGGPLSNNKWIHDLKVEILVDFPYKFIKKRFRFPNHNINKMCNKMVR